MELLFSILLGAWLVGAGLFYRFFIKKEYDKYGVSMSDEATK